MKETMRVVVMAPLLVLLVFLVASLPERLAVRSASLVLEVHAPISRIIDYLTGVATGDVFSSYRAGRMEQSFASDLPDYLRISFLFATVGTTIGLIVGSAAGFRAALANRRRRFDVIVFLGSIPDFLFIVLSQLAVIGITRLTRVRIARAGSAGLARPAILLPIVALSLYAAVAAMRGVRERINRIRTIEYLVGAIGHAIAPYPVDHQELQVHGRDGKLSFSPAPPTVTHPLGTDEWGYVILTPMLHGLKYTLMVSLSSAAHAIRRSRQRAGLHPRWPESNRSALHADPAAGGGSWPRSICRLSSLRFRRTRCRYAGANTSLPRGRWGPAAAEP